MSNHFSVVLDSIKAKDNTNELISSVERARSLNMVKFYMGIGYFVALTVLTIKLFV